MKLRIIVSLLSVILIGIQHVYGNQGLVMSREQCRRAKFHLKSVTHSVNKLLKLDDINTLIAKELNLVLDF